MLTISELACILATSENRQTLDVPQDFMKAARKLNDAKKLESSATYDSSFGDGGKS